MQQFSGEGRYIDDSKSTRPCHINQFLKQSLIPCRIEELPTLLKDVYEIAFSRINEIDSFSFPDILKQPINEIDELCGWTFDCHSLSGSLMQHMGVLNFPLLLPNDEDLPGTANVMLYKTVEAWSNRLKDITSELHFSNSSEFLRIFKFRYHFMENADIRIQFQAAEEPNNNGTSNEDKVLSKVIASMYSNKAKSRFCLLTTHKEDKKFDRHSLVILGETKAGDDLIVIDKACSGFDIGKFRVRKMSDVLHYYRSKSPWPGSINEVLLTSSGIHAEIAASADYQPKPM